MPAMPETQPLTLADVATRIVKEAGGIDVQALPFGDHVVWYGLSETVSNNADGSVTTTKSPMIFKVGQAVPSREKSIVFHIFADEDEVRVYTAPGREAVEPGDRVLRVYHLSKRGPVCFVENLPIDAFVTAVASEWSVVQFDMKPIDRERQDIATFLREQAASGQAPSTYDLANLIETGEYEEDDAPESHSAGGTPQTNAPGAPAGESQ